MEVSPVARFTAFPVAQTKALPVSIRFSLGSAVLVEGALTREATRDIESVGFVAKYDRVTVAADAESEV
jgi:hypothetical protein